VAEDSTNGSVTRRRVLEWAAALPAVAAAARAAPASERYKLGVMATMYSALPLDDAMARIRKAGYRYISMGRRHAEEDVFSPEMTKAERAAMLRRIRDLGVDPINYGPCQGLHAGRQEDRFASPEDQLGRRKCLLLRRGLSRPRSARPGAACPCRVHQGSPGVAR
jgi:hypothetical protein